MKRILPLFTFMLLSVIWCFTTKSQTTINVGGINYSIIDSINNYVEVGINSTNTSASITIDSTIEYNNVTYTVTRVGDSAFINCSNLTTLSLPATITSIGLNAFVNSGLCSTSSNLILYSIYPPAIVGNPFNASGQGRTPVLHVPCVAFVNYQDSYYDLWHSLAQVPQMFFRGIEGDTVIQSYDTICRGPYTYSIYNPYVQIPINKTEVIQQNGYRLLETHIPNIQGCKITGKINITVRSQGSYNTETHYICPNTTFTWHNEEHNFDTVISDTGSYTFSFPDGECNDITFLKIIASDTIRTEQTIDRCKGEFYLEVNPIDSSVYFYYEDEDFDFPLHTFRGCDSIVVKHLRFHELGDDSTYREVCKGDTIHWTVNGYYSIKHYGDSTYVFNTDTLDVGTHTIIDNNYTTRYGCSNKKTLFITINPLKFDTIRETICWNELPYNQYNFSIEKSESLNIDTLIVKQNKSVTYNGCDSTSTLLLTIKPITDTIVNIDACKGGIWSPDSPYTRDNDGSILSSQTLKITADTLYTSILQKENGCDSIVRYNVTFWDTINETTHRTICYGDTIRWITQGYDGNTNEGIIIDGSGLGGLFGVSSKQQSPINKTPSDLQIDTTDFSVDSLSVGVHKWTHLYETEKGCKNIQNINITVNPTYDTTFIDSICYNALPYTQHGFNITKYSSDVSNNLNTIYRTDNLTTHLGCDSVVHLQLTIKPTKSVTIRDSICFGSDYHANGFDVEGDTVQAFQGTTKTITKINPGQTYLGCDSTTTLYLVFINNKVRNINEQICYGSVYNQNNFSINSSDYNNEYQIIKDTNNNLSYLGCDSTTILSLTITPTHNQTFTDTICYGSSYNQHGFNISFNSYKRTTNYNSNWDTIQYSKTKNLYTKTYNCDSTVTLNLLIQPKFDTTIYANICLDGSYNEWGFNLRGDELGIGTFNRQRLLHRVTGCDSIINLQLTVSALLETDISASVCYGETYNLNGFNINTNDSTERNTSFYIKDSLHLQTVAGCDSTVRLSLRVDPIFEQSISMTICDNETFDFNGRILNTAGNYDTTLQTINGCDSIIHLTLNVNPTKNTRIDTAIIQNNTYTFGSRQLNTAGIYVDSLRTYLGCDSVVTLNLVVWENQTTTFNESICKGDTFTSYNFDQTHGFICDTAGRYVQHLSTTQGADSTVILNLVVFPTYDTTITESICWGQRYTENNFNILSSDSIENPINNMGIINSVLKLQTINGCDSIVHLQLNVNPTKSTRIDTSVCEGFVSNDFYGFEVNTIGMHDGRIYTDTRTVPTLAGGCDSVVSLYIQVNPVYNDIYNEEICYQETYIGHGFNIPTDTSANIEHTITFIHRDTTIFGCDSTTTLHLTIHPKDTTYIEHTLCYGENYTDNGFNIHTGDSVPLESVRTIYDTLRLQSQYSCDSVVCLTLNVNPTRNTQLYTTLCEGENYTENGFNVNSTGIHRDTTFSVTRTVQTIGNVGCDSTVVLNVTVHPVYNDTILRSICFGETYSDYGFNVASTDYNNEEQVLYFTNRERSFWNCDSLMTLVLTIHPVYDTTITENICWGQTYSENNFFILTSDSVANPKNTMANISSTLYLQSIYGCDSIVHLNLNVYPIYDTSITIEICDNETFNFNNRIVSVAGNYDTTLQTISGCDSVVHLSLIVHPTFDTTIIDSICFGATYTLNNFNESQAGSYTQSLQSQYGCDSIVHLELKVMNFNDTIEMHLCDGQSYDFHGRILNESGFYRDTLQSIWQCDSIINIDLTIHPNYNDTIYDTICSNFAYNLYNFHIDSAEYLPDTTNYRTQNLQSIWGCDSIVTLALWVWPTYEIHIEKEICEGGHYTDHGYELYFVTQDTTKVVSSFVSSHGCDSIFVLNLYVRPTYDTTIFANICRGETFTMEGYDFNCTESGVYKDTLRSAYSCDSIKTINLTVHDHYEVSITDSICLGGIYQRDGFYCTGPGIYKDTLQTFWGCDSIRTLFLWPKPSYNISVDTSICSGSDYYFGDRLLTYSGQYIDTFSTVGGCDSIVTLYLTINAPYTDSIEASICEGEVYDLHGFYATETGRYIDTFTTVGGCDSIRILNLHVKPSYHDTIEQTICSGEIFSELGFHADRPGYYTHSGNTYLGCDSTIILHLNVNDKIFDTLNIEICEGEEYRENNFNENSTGIYDRHLETSYGCDSIVTLNLTVNKVYDDTISAVIKEGNTFDLYNFYEDQDGVYSQYLTSSKGCDSTVTLVLEIDRDAKLFIPNAFTPLDRYNNTFCVYPQEEIVHLKSFKIFNRWGTLLWQTDDITQCWNGIYEGKFVPQGVYVYKVEYYRDTEPNEILEEKGSVMVLY